LEEAVKCGNYCYDEPLDALVQNQVESLKAERLVPSDVPLDVAVALDELPVGGEDEELDEIPVIEEDI
jgi:hypothetical protein